MKTCIFDIKRFAVHDGPGIRLTVFFKGCPLSCLWCHNPEGISGEQETFHEIRQLDGKCIPEQLTVGKMINLDQLIDDILDERIFFDESGGGVTLSGGEPLLHDEFIRQLLAELGKHNIHRCIDTSGCVPRSVIEALAADTDLFLYDLKLMDDNQHRRHTGVSNRIILENLELLNRIKANVIIRFPMVAGITDSVDNVSTMIGFLDSLDQVDRVDLLPYHAFARSKYRRFYKNKRTEQLQAPDEQELARVREQFRNAGYITERELIYE